MMVHRSSAMNEKDKHMTDTARLHQAILQIGNTQQRIYRWDEMLSVMKKRPPDEDLMNLFVLQLDVNLPKNHEFGVDLTLVQQALRRCSSKLRGHLEFGSRLDPHKAGH